MADESPVIPGVPAHAAANHRRSVIAAALLGAAALAILAPMGHPLAGVFVIVGLALGALNTWMVQQSVAAFAAEGSAAGKKRKFVMGVASRLAFITLVALIVVLLFRPDGLGILGGLALFQILMVGAAALPVMKELKKA